MRGQSSVEFLVLLGFMIIIFSSFFVLAQDLVVSYNDRNVQEAAIIVAEQVRDELVLANQVREGYARSFELQPLILEREYTARVVDGRDLVVTVSPGTSQELQHIIFLPFTVGGDEDLGVENRVTKREGEGIMISLERDFPE